MNLCRLSLIKQILFHSILMKEATTDILKSGMLLTEQYWFVREKLIILLITTLFPSFLIRIGHVPLGLSKSFSNFLSPLYLPCNALSRERD